MKIELTNSIAPNSATEKLDVLQLKKSLNRLGYYYPHEDIGITDIPDSALFSAIKKFQENFGLSVTGTAKPEDDTIASLNRELAKPQKGLLYLEHRWRRPRPPRTRGHGWNNTVMGRPDNPRYRIRLSLLGRTSARGYSDYKFPQR